MPILLLPAALAAWTWAFAGGSGIREAFLKSLLLCGGACVLMTEALSPFHAFTRVSIAAGWIVVILAAGPLLKKPTLPAWPRGLDILYLLAIAVIVAITGYTALLSAPNSTDAMAYHLPRVIYWVQARSVAFFPTPYLNQIMLQPFAEYAMAHTYLLSGGDRFVNLVQFTGFVGSIVAAACIAKVFGLSFRGQAIASLVCASLPNAVLQASGAKNDCLLSLWLAAMVLFAARRQVVFLALALALALGTKATAYLFVPPVLLIAWVVPAKARRIDWAAVAILATGVLVLDGPQYIRNFQLSGSIMGFDSAFADGSFRWRNETLGWRPTASNLMRNVSDQLGARGDTWNTGVYRTVLKLHQILGIDPQDPATTWKWTAYGPPRNANHEADANNRWHLLLLFAALAAAGYRKERIWIIYGSGLAAAFLLFCFYLKWQPFFSRLELPLFILATPLIANAVAALRPALLPFAVCLFLFDGTRHPLLDNWTRPLRGPDNLRVEPRELQYFNDMTQWHNRDFYFSEAGRIAGTGCEIVGIDSNQNQLEYPLQALLLERNPRIRFVHVNVNNPSRRYGRETDPQPCAIVYIR